MAGIPKKLIVNRGFILRGYWIPPFELTPGKMLRIYIPNFSLLNEPLGCELALELAELFSKRKEIAGLEVAQPLPYVQNYRQTLWERIFWIKTAKNYLSRKYGASSSQAAAIITQLGIKPNERISYLGWDKRRCLTIKGLLIHNTAVSFDYYGISFANVDKLNNVIHQSLREGKCAISFDNLQYMEEGEPYENFERIVITPLPQV